MIEDKGVILSVGQELWFRLKIEEDLRILTTPENLAKAVVADVSLQKVKETR